MHGRLPFLFLFITVSSSTGRVLNELSCDFDGTFCNYQVFDESFSQEISVRDGTPRASEALDGPLQGHRDSASFLQINTTRDIYWAMNWTAQLISREVALEGEYCISLDYYLASPMGALHVFATKELNTIMRNKYYLFSRSRASSYVDRWQHYQQSLNFSAATYKIAIFGSKLAALDNLKFRGGACLNENELIKCDFDHIQDSDSYTGLGCSFLRQLPPPAGNETLYGHWQLSKSDFSGNDHTTGTNYGRFLTPWVTGNLPAMGSHFTSLVLYRATPSDGRHCLSFSMKTSNLKWKIIERGINDGIDYVLAKHYSAELANYQYLRKAIEIDPIDEIEIILSQDGQLDHNLGRGYFYLDTLDVRKGRCPPKVDCDFSRDGCDSNLIYHDHLTNWLLGTGRAYDTSQLNSSPASRNAGITKPYLYSDFTSDTAVWGNSFTTPLIEDVRSYCFWLTYYAERVKRVLVMVHSDVQHSHKELQPSNLTFPNVPRWTRFQMDIRHKEPFYVQVDIPRPTAGVHPVFEVNEVKLESGSCAEVNVRNTNPQEQPDFPQVRFHCYKTGHYISQHLACDGVIDCPMGEDEDHCQHHDCSMNGIPCKMRGRSFCLGDERICDGHDDCQDGVDEDPKLCKKDEFEKNYCLNRGELYYRAFSCRCKPGFIGKRCQKPANDDFLH